MGATDGTSRLCNTKKCTVTVTHGANGAKRVI